MFSRAPLPPFVLGLILALPFAGPALAAPPEEGDCPTLSADSTSPDGGSDAVPIVVKEGMVIDQESLLVLQRLVPSEIWRYREVFFFEGMRMVVGSCHRRYGMPLFHRQATEKFRGQPTLDRNGNIDHYNAGVPFPPEDIDPEQKDAATRWAWNMALRYRGAGHSGKFRLVDLPSMIGGAITYEGNFYLLQAAGRADLPASRYRVPDSGDRQWIAGGEFERPFDARGLAWRQFRPLETLERYQEADDTFVYVPSMRKSRRAATTWVDGFFFPRFSATGDGGGGGIAFGGGLGGAGGGAINPTGAQSAAASEDVRRGFTGVTIRPNAYLWRSLGERDVLAPINSITQGYPIETDRNYGPSGLSMASDRWDVRRAVVIEGALKLTNQDVRTITIYLDYQTQVPLFWVSRTSRRRFLEIGVLVHRFSGDNPSYPEWPGGVPANVFEPVAASFYNALEGGGGWRRESYDLKSLPFPNNERRRLMSVDQLSRGH